MGKHEEDKVAAEKAHKEEEAEKKRTEDEEAAERARKETEAEAEKKQKEAEEAAKKHEEDKVVAEKAPKQQEELDKPIVKEMQGSLALWTVVLVRRSKEERYGFTQYSGKDDFMRYIKESHPVADSDPPVPPEVLVV